MAMKYLPRSYDDDSSEDDSSEYDSSEYEFSDDDISDVELFEEKWFHGSKPTREIKKLLRDDGDFLVHTSKDKSTKATEFILSVFWKQLRDFQIRHDRTGWTVEGNSYANLPTLINNLKGKSVTNDSEMILKRPIVKEEWKLKNVDIVLKKEIASGNFGKVYLGIYKPKEMQVAVKKSNKSMSEDETNKFVREGVTLAKLSHPNIVGLIGIVVQQQPMIVMEYVPGGDLHTYLTHLKGRPTYLPTLIKMCEDAACGMAYLEKKGVIHRDLAARNCLVDKSRVKINDFGMSREEDIYMRQSSDNFPVRWTAPESLTNEVYTSKSDVWSFGILMWEIFSRGDQPYPDISKNYTVAEKVKRGYNMDAPAETPEGCYNLMKNCWEFNPNDRYSFKRIKQELKVIHENM